MLSGRMMRVIFCFIRPGWVICFLLVSISCWDYRRCITIDGLGLGSLFFYGFTGMDDTKVNNSKQKLT